MKHHFTNLLVSLFSSFFCAQYYCFTSMVSSTPCKNQFDTKSSLSNEMSLYTVALSKGFGLAVPHIQTSKLNKNQSYALQGSVWSYVGLQVLVSNESTNLFLLQGFSLSSTVFVFGRTCKQINLMGNLRPYGFSDHKIAVNYLP